MSKIRKALAFAVAMVMICCASIALTAAYLTDRDSEANVFTVGDVAIDLLGKFDDEPVPLPGIPVDDPASVKNIGKNEAWIWATVAYPKALDPVVRLDTDATDVWSKLNTATAEKDGAEYSLVTYLHNAPVAPGAETAPFLLSAALDSRVDITPDGDWYLVEAGNTTPIGWNSEENGAPVMYVSAYAIQTEGFATVADGWAAYQAQWGDKGTEWGETDGTEEEGGAPSLPTSVEIGDTGLVLSCEDGISDDDYSCYGGYLYIYTANPIVLSMDEGAPPTKTSIYLNAANADLTIKGLNLNNMDGIIAEKPATLRVEGTNTLAFQLYAVYAMNSLQITGDGTLIFKDGFTGLCAENSAITVGCAVKTENVSTLCQTNGSGSIETVDGGTINGKPYPEPAPSLPTSVEIGDTGLVLSCEDGITDDDYLWYGNGLNISTDKPVVLSMAEDAEQAEVNYIQFATAGADLTIENLTLNTSDGIIFLYPGTLRVSGSNTIRSYIGITSNGGDLQIVGDGTLVFKDGFTGLYASNGMITVGCTVTTTEVVNPFITESGSIITVDGGTINGQSYPAP